MSLSRPIVDLQTQMERLFGDLTQGFGFPNREEMAGRYLPSGELKWIPAIEVSETENEVAVRVEIPGVKPENIDVEVVSNILTVSGEVREEKRDKEANVHRTEFRYGRFLRRIPLPTEVKSDNAKAEFHDGILELKLPKAEESKRKRIKVTTK